MLCLTPWVLCAASSLGSRFQSHHTDEQGLSPFRPAVGPSKHCGHILSIEQVMEPCPRVACPSARFREHQCVHTIRSHGNTQGVKPTIRRRPPRSDKAHFRGPTTRTIDSEPTRITIRCELQIIPSITIVRPVVQGLLVPACINPLARTQSALPWAEAFAFLVEAAVILPISTTFVGAHEGKISRALDPLSLP